MDKKVQDKINSCAGNDGCAPDLNDGKAIVNKVRQVGVSNGLLAEAHNVECECGTTFQMTHFEMSCPNCNMTFAVTPCSAHDKNNIKQAGIGY